MKALIKIFPVFLFLAFSINAFSQKDMDSQKVTITIQDNNRYEVKSESNNKEGSVKSIQDDTNLKNLGLSAGTVLVGDFTAKEFVSKEGAERTRIATGELVFSSAVDSGGNSIGCPPFCDKSIIISFVLNDVKSGR